MARTPKKDDLVFCPLGGSGEIGMNMNLYGFGPPGNRQWIMIDCGVMFGGPATPGIDVITPDPAFIMARKDQLLGVVLTHAHEDHIGATALLGPQFECPVFATPFTAKLVEGKLMQSGVDLDLRVIEMGARFSLGPFDLEYITLTHSIPEPNAIAIRTPLGNILHTGDWKLDDEPTLGPVTDQTTLKAFGEEGVRAIVCDSTNVLSKGVSGSEMRVKENLISLIKGLRGAVAVTTFASNVSRVVSICEAAAAADRSVCLLGRSMLRITSAARDVGLLPEGLSFIDPHEARAIPADHVLYLCTGSQGEPRAALARIAREDHPEISLRDGDTVVFSSKIIPGNEREIFDLQNSLVDIGVEIITEKDAFIHVSGHPNQDELRQMYEWAQPEYAIPVHGEARHLETHADFAIELGVKDAIAPRNGDIIRIAPGAPAVIDEAPAGRLMLDGDFLLPAAADPLRERRKLSYAGMVVASVSLSAEGNLASPASAVIHGAPRHSPDGESDDEILELVEEAIEEAVESLSRARRRKGSDDDVEVTITRAVRNKMIGVWGKRPIVKTIIHRV